MPPIPVEDLFGVLRAKTRANLNEFVDKLLKNDECFNRYEALRLLQEEIACLEAEERAKQLVVRGWGETLDFGLLQETSEPAPWTQRLFDIMRIASCKRKDEGTYFQQDLKMSIAFDHLDQVTSVKTNTVVDVCAHYSNHVIGDYEEDSLAVTEDDEDEDEDEDEDDDEEEEEEEEEDESDDEEDGNPFAARNRQDLNGIDENSMDSDEVAQYAQMMEGLGVADADVHSEDDELEDGYDDENEDDDDDHDDDDDEEDDDENGEHDDGPKTRVDYWLKMSQPNLDKGVSKVIMAMSFTTCSRHAWSPEFYEDETKVGDTLPDFYFQFERTGTRDAYGMLSKQDEFDARTMWAAEKRPPRFAVKKKQENFVLSEVCECVVCHTRHKFRIEVNWETLYQLVRLLQPAFPVDCRIEPETLYRFESRISDPSDALFPFVRATRILAFFMAFTAGSSGFSVSPIDFFFGSVVADGIPIFSALRFAEFLAEYESDGSLGVD